MNETVSSNDNIPIIVYDVLDALQKKKLGKAVGYDGIAMEPLIYGSPRFIVHLVFSLI